MPAEFQFNNPVTLGDLDNLVTVSGVRVVAFKYSETPQLGQLGTGEFDVVLQDVHSGLQRTISYRDASVLPFWASLVGNVEQAILNKLSTDGKLPAGTLIAPVSTTATLAAPATVAAGADITVSAQVAAASGTPTGTMILAADRQIIATADVPASGQVDFVIQLAAGTHKLFAFYLATGAFTSDLSSGATITVS